MRNMHVNLWAGIFESHHPRNPTITTTPESRINHVAYSLRYGFICLQIDDAKQTTRNPIFSVFVGGYVLPREPISTFALRHLLSEEAETR